MNDTVKKRKPTTHVLAVIDRSASMRGMAEEVRSGFNAYMDDLQADKDYRYRVTVTQFNHEVDRVGTAQKPKDVVRFTNATYSPVGMTALYDAICMTVNEFAETVELPPGDRVLVVIQTDGHENMSQEHVLADVRQLIRGYEETGRWTFLYHGIGPDSWQGGRLIGTQSYNTVNTTSARDVGRSSYTGLSAGTKRYAGGAGAQSVGEAVAAAVGEELRP